MSSGVSPGTHSDSVSEDPIYSDRALDWLAESARHPDATPALGHRVSAARRMMISVAALGSLALKLGEAPIWDV